MLGISDESPKLSSVFISQNNDLMNSLGNLYNLSATASVQSLRVESSSPSVFQFDQPGRLNVLGIPNQDSQTLRITTPTLSDTFLPVSRLHESILTVSPRVHETVSLRIESGLTSKSAIAFSASVQVEPRLTIGQHSASVLAITSDRELAINERYANPLTVRTSLAYSSINPDLLASSGRLVIDSSRELMVRSSFLGSLQTNVLSTSHVYDAAVGSIKLQTPAENFLSVRSAFDQSLGNISLSTVEAGKAFSILTKADHFITAFPLESKSVIISSSSILADSYKALWADTSVLQTSAFRSGIISFDDPNTEMYLAGKQVESFESTEEEEEAEPLYERIKRENAHFLSDLKKVEPSLDKLFIGAHEAFVKKHTDYKRHCAVSLRELITHVLHILSPDKAFHEWNKGNPEFIHDKKPTRQGRLKFILRNIDNSTFEKFLEKDIKSNLEFINMLQGGTHAIESQFADNQMEIMLTRAESLMKILIKASWS